jgi:DNA-binding NtrC family response regulator
MDLLMKHDYPGNVRELENLIERAVVMARGDLLTTDDLPAALRSDKSPSPSPALSSLPEVVETLEREAIAKALREAGGNQSRAAAALGLTERHLRYKLKKYGMKE